MLLKRTISLLLSTILVLGSALPVAAEDITADSDDRVISEIVDESMDETPDESSDTTETETPDEIPDESKTVSFTIVPKATSVSSLTPVSGGFIVKWAKRTPATGYEIQYSTSSTFKAGSATKTVKVG